MRGNQIGGRRDDSFFPYPVRSGSPLPCASQAALSLCMAARSIPFALIVLFLSFSSVKSCKLSSYLACGQTFTISDFLCGWPVPFPVSLSVSLYLSISTWVPVLGSQCKRDVYHQVSQVIQQLPDDQCIKSRLLCTKQFILSSSSPHCCE